ncbi:hypothetical protein [uncultured Bartonella sp.]|nr:hypothetical protein [uncultured Bartonella sp.]
MGKLPVNHERASDVAEEVTPPLKGGKLEKQVEKEKSAKNNKR